ncbi:MAG: oxidoreductase [Gammaproteobacteria bacterium]|nr:MAG: oxidoreductase [Gammaproteobacteria bacterium]PHR81815.1 MAG: oxidoreductase [Colwellia sp.]
MTIINVSNLYIYPIKSTKGISLPYADIDELGLAFDRRFVISDNLGQFITARTEPTLCLVTTILTEHGITLSAPSMPTLTLEYKVFNNQYQNVEVWGDEIAGQRCSTTANSWFSEYLQRPCQLLYFGQESSRVKNANTDKARKLAFADGYPLLLISQASLDDLNQRLLADNQQTVSMAQFRPNIVVDNCLPFAEDGWQYIRIGEIDFKVSKPCERCVFTTVNPTSGIKHAQQQPLRTLKSYRQTTNGAVLFGQNLIPLTSGSIKQGDKLNVVTQQKPPTFTHSNSTPVTAIMNKNKKINIHFETWHKDHPADNQKTLLEHGEAAGLIMPSSCRGGMCGRCKAKLISGEVTQLADEGLSAEEKQQGYILCCSSIAQSDVVIKHR